MALLSALLIPAVGNRVDPRRMTWVVTHPHQILTNAPTATSAAV